MNPVRPFRYSASSTGLLAENRKHANASRFALCLYRQNAIYSYIPKNACSTMRLSLALANGCIADKTDHAWIHLNNSTFAASLRDMVDTNYTFTILRCPFDRVVSVFMDKIVGEGDGHQGLSFSGFLHQLNQQNWLKRNLHWRPQIDFLVYQHYDDVFSVENMAGLVTTLKEKIHFDVVDARPYTRHGREKLERVSDRSYADVPAAELRSMRQAGATPETAAFYSPQCAQLVSQLYRDDLPLYRHHLGDSALMRQFADD